MHVVSRAAVADPPSTGGRTTNGPASWAGPFVVVLSRGRARGGCYLVLTVILAMPTTSWSVTAVVPNVLFRRL
ncbi:hypothetical protein, partial [Clavibacter michiganensis]|uniref:hypothetical protein n=2 Tax=Clavibacter michiganensis TaxID=28447 RepID=UPI00292DAAD7